MTYTTIFGKTYDDEHDEEMSHKYGETYDYFKKMYPDIKKLPSDEISGIYQVYKQSPAGDTFEKSVDRTKKYIESNLPSWKQTYLPQSQSYATQRQSFKPQSQSYSSQTRPSAYQSQSYVPQTQSFTPQSQQATRASSPTGTTRVLKKANNYFPNTYISAAPSDLENNNQKFFYAEPAEEHSYSNPYSNSASNSDKIEQLKCAAHGYVQGVSLDWLDEIAGSGASAYEGLAAWRRGDPDPWQKSKEAYLNTRNNLRDHYAYCMENYPVTTTAANLAGTTTTTMLAAPAGVAGTVALGAVGGLGAGEGELQDQLTSTGFGATSAYFGNKFAKNQLSYLEKNASKIARATDNATQYFTPVKHAYRNKVRIKNFSRDPLTHEILANTYGYLINDSLHDLYDGIKY